MRHFITAPIVVAVALALAHLASSCSQPPVSCTVSTFTGYAAKYKLVEGTGSCAARPGDIIGLAAYNPPKRDSYDNIVPNLDEVSLAIRTETLGALAAFAADSGIVDEADGHVPHAFGPFTSAFPQGDICTAELGAARQEFDAIPGDGGDPEDPDDDLPAQDAVAMGETWSDVQVFVTAANLGTQMKATYTVTDDVEGCSATYDVLAVFPAVFCEDIVAEGEPLDIESINDIEAVAPDVPEALGTVLVATTAPHGLAEGDLVDIVGADDDERSYDGTYSVAFVVDDRTFRTNEVDPSDGDDPDPAGDAGTVQKLASVPNPSYCSATAIPEEGIAVGSGISPDFPVVCDPELLLCVLEPAADDQFPVVK